MPARDVFDDLEEETARLEAIFEGLADEQWEAPSGAPGWRICDVALHLAQSDELVAATIDSGTSALRPDGHEETSVDVLIETMVQAQRTDASTVLPRFKAARRAALTALRAADPDTAVAWAATPLRPRTLATTRLAEHWSHGLDVTVPLGIEFPDTDRLWHVARLGYRTLPYAFGLRGKQAPVLFCRLTGPGGDEWTFGEPDAPAVVTGPAGEFCRVGARRLAPGDSHLQSGGSVPDAAAEALRLLRNYAA
ncbi:MAG: maleylpyruvate isomerase family mycothiol-dependent enzyme [Acidimicrobiales bacterium]